MQSFKEITDRLKTIIGSTKDKDIAIKLNIKPATFASMKRRQRIPYKAILGYCREHNIDADRVLLGKVDMPIEEGKVRVKYFRTLEDYALWLTC